MDDNTKLRDAMHRAAAAVILQGSRSVDESDTCAYRGDGGRKCVVGHIIADEHYDRGFEGCPAHNSEVRTAVSASLGVGVLSLQQVNELSFLQEWHDDVGDGEGVRSSVRHTTESFADWKLRTLPDFIDRALVERLVREGRANG